MFSRNDIKDKVIEFVDSIDLLSKSALDGEKACLEYEVKEARHLIKYSEWFIAF